MEGVKETAKMFKEAFPDLKITINNIAAECDMVYCYYTMTGTNTGSFMGQPATNKSINITGVDIVRCKDGKATEHWAVTDDMKMMTQLGMLPQPGSDPAQMAEGSATGEAPAAPAAQESQAPPKQKRSNTLHFKSPDNPPSGLFVYA